MTSETCKILYDDDNIPFRLYKNTGYITSKNWPFIKSVGECILRSPTPEELKKYLDNYDSVYRLDSL